MYNQARTEGRCHIASAKSESLSEAMLVKTLEASFEAH